MIQAHAATTRTDGTIEPGSAGYWHYHDHCKGTPHGTDRRQEGLVRRADRAPCRRPRTRPAAARPRHERTHLQPEEGSQHARRSRPTSGSGSSSSSSVTVSCSTPSICTATVGPTPHRARASHRPTDDAGSSTTSRRSGRFVRVPGHRRRAASARGVDVPLSRSGPLRRRHGRDLLGEGRRRQSDRRRRREALTAPEASHGAKHHGRMSTMAASSVERKLLSGRGRAARRRRGRAGAARHLRGALAARSPSATTGSTPKR